MPKTMKKFWTFQNQKEDKKAELLIYGPVASSSWWGDEVTPKEFKKEMDALGEIDELNVYINSDGGDAFAGQAIYSMLKRYKAQVNVYIDGLAASIASVIAMAGDRVYMPANAMMMVHNPWTFALGDAVDLRKMADDLDKVRESILTVYREKTGLEDKKLIEIMDSETWMTAQEAIDYGFIDGIEEQKQVAASLNAGKFVVNGQEMNLERYKNPPKMLINAAKKEEKPEKRLKIENEPGDRLFLLQKIIELKKKKYKEE